MTGPAVKLSQSLVTGALSRFEADILASHLADVQLDVSGVNTLLGFVLRADALIIPYKNAAKEASRDAVIEVIRDALVGRGHGSGVAALDEVIAQLGLAELGYRTVLETLGRAEISQLKPAARVAAILERALNQYDRVMDAANERMRSQRYSLPQSLTLRIGDRAVSVDGLVESLVLDVGASLTMEAIKGRWVDASEVVVLPDLAQVGEGDVERAGSNELCAAAWRNWRHLEESARFLGGRIVDRPAAMQDADNHRLLAFEGDTGWYGFAAQTRANDQFTQSYMEQIHQHGADRLVTDLEDGVALPPHGVVAADEVVHYLALSETFGFPIVEDETDYDGLRLIEWLRGFEVLNVLANRRMDRPGNAGSAGSWIYQEQELLRGLIQGGLTEAKARVFLAAATFKRTSRDLFDAPLIQLRAGGRLLFAPAILGQGHAAVVQSVLASRGLVVAGKGEAFEARVLQLFDEVGLEAQTIDVKRDGASYQFDAVLDWGDYVFLFECKNRSIARQIPKDAFHFSLAVSEHVQQMKRLVQALERWPDILSDRFGRDLSGKTLVPCVLNNLPYARSEPVDGVLFYDFSALARFFTSRHMHAKSVHRTGQNSQLIEHIKMAPLWAGEHPTAEDLVQELRDPMQLRIVKAHAELSWPTFPLGDTVAAAYPQWLRHDITPFTMADFSGVPRDAVRLRMDRARRKAAKLRRREARRP